MGTAPLMSERAFLSTKASQSNREFSEEQIWTCSCDIYLGHVVGQGHVKPVNAKVEAIFKYSVPTSKKELMRFLGMAGYYRNFCRNLPVFVSI